MSEVQEPLISIIIPIYKVEPYIANCIQSVVEQTYSNLEIILVDDGSPDNSTDIAENVLKNNGKNYIVIHQENKGLGEARNSGLNKANGEWVYFLDSDDMIVPETIEHLVAATKRETDFVFSNYRIITDKAEAYGKFAKADAIYYNAEIIRKEFLLRKKIILAPGTLYRKDFLDRNKLRFEKIPWSEDQQFMFRLLRIADKIGYVEEPLYQYLQRAGSIMNATEPQKILEGYKAILQVASTFENDSLFGKFIAARWVMGSLNSAARMYDFNVWQTLYQDLDGKKWLKKLLKFPDIKVKTLSLVGVVSPKLYYKTNRR